MAIPSVNMLSNEPGGGLVAAMGGVNALRSALYDTQVKKAQAQYAPYTTYADALSKIAYANMTPYEIQAKVLSNPMVWSGIQELQKTNPQAAQQMMNGLMNSTPSAQSLMSAGNMPPPPQGQGNPFMNALNNLFGGSSSAVSQQQPSPNNLMQQGSDNAPDQPPPSAYAPAPIPGQSSPVPSDQSLLAPGGSKGVLNSMTNKYNQQAATPGATTATDSGPVSVADASTVAASQQAIQGIENLQPILKDIMKGAPRFLATGEKGKLAVGEKMNELQQSYGSLFNVPKEVMKYVGVTNKDVSDYDDWQAQQQKAVETIMKARQWPNVGESEKRIADIVRPQPGEGPEYGDRMGRELSQYMQQVLPGYQNTLNNGFPLTQKVHPDVSIQLAPQYENAKQAINKTANDFKSQPEQLKGVDPRDGKMKNWTVPQGQVQMYLDNGFKRVS